MRKINAIHKFISTYLIKTAARFFKNCFNDNITKFDVRPAFCYWPVAIYCLFCVHAYLTLYIPQVWIFISCQQKYGSFFCKNLISPPCARNIKDYYFRSIWFQLFNKYHDYIQVWGEENNRMGVCIWFDIICSKNL